MWSLQVVSLMCRQKKCLGVSMFVKGLIMIERQVEASHSLSIDTY